MKPCPKCQQRPLSFLQYWRGAHAVWTDCRHCGCMLKANRITWIWLAVCLLLLVIFFVFLFANIGNQEVSGALLKPALLGFVGLCAMLAWLTGGYVVDPVAEQHAAAQADAPACPECGQPLRSAAARQCFNCGADWHDRLPDAE